MMQNPFEQPASAEKKNPLEKIPLAIMLLEDVAERISAGRHISEKDIETGKFDAEIAKAEAFLKTSFNQHQIGWGDSKFQSALEDNPTLSPLGRELFLKVRNVITSREERRMKNVRAINREGEKRFEAR